MEPRPFSIKLFLADGTPEGLRIVEKSNWSGMAYVFGRGDLARVRVREQLSRPGVYVLSGRSEADSSRLRIYIGEADDLPVRIAQHASQKEFWQRVIAFMSKDDELNKAHARYLEARLLQRAAQAKRADIDNGNVPSLPKLSEAEMAYADAFLEDMLLIYPVIGLDAFEIPLTSMATSASAKLFLDERGARATGREDGDQFIVFAGSIARKDTVPSMHSFTKVIREQLIEDGVMLDRKTHYEFNQDYAFESPSSASAVLVGGPSNGRRAWKATTGQTLKELQETAATVSA